MRATLFVPLLLIGCVHAPAHANRDLHGPPDVLGYIRGLEDPHREVVAKLPELLASLGLRSGDTVGDIGCGPGVVTAAVAKVVAPGVVYAEDVEPAQLDRVNERAAAEGLDNVVPVLGVYANPRLPRGAFDWLLLVDMFHHLDDRPAYLVRLKDLLRAGGKVAVVDWGERPAGVGPPASHTLSREAVVGEMTQAGFFLSKAPALFQYQYVLIFDRGTVEALAP